VDGNEVIFPIATKTVDSAQGTEYDIVLISFVQTRRPAFLGEPHRLIVALTRARWMLGIYTVLDPTTITPPSSLTVMLERRQDPSYQGRRSERPFVNFTLPTVNFRVAQSEEDLASRMVTAPTVRVAN
jgi:hypothetical protein